MHEDLLLITKKLIPQNLPKIFTKTPLKLSSISLTAEKKYGNYDTTLCNKCLTILK